jgi:predicted anti-sigma-YlaC factor YlaD
LGGHFKNQWNNSRGFFKQWWRQMTDRQPEQQPASYYPPQTGSGISRPRKRRRKHYQNGGAFGMPSFAGKLTKIGTKYGGQNF